MQVFLSDGFRDFADTPISIAQNATHSGLALADVDGNGTLDIVVSTDAAQTGYVFGNDGAGNFSLLADLDAAFSRDVAVGDINGDGFVDIAFATPQGNPVYLGNGLGGFTLDASLGTADSHGVAVADLNGDGRDDVVFANTGTNSAVWLRTAVGGFTSATVAPVWGCRIGYGW